MEELKDENCRNFVKKKSNCLSRFRNLICVIQLKSFESPSAACVYQFTASHSNFGYLIPRENRNLNWLHSCGCEPSMRVKFNFSTQSFLILPESKNNNLKTIKLKFLER